MIRFFSRTVAVVLFLSLLAVPSAQAAPLGGAQWISKMPVRWMDATLSWLSNLLPGKTPAPAQPTTEKILPINPGNGPSEEPQYTGSCIDPLGNPCVVDPEL